MQMFPGFKPSQLTKEQRQAYIIARIEHSQRIIESSKQQQAELQKEIEQNEKIVRFLQDSRKSLSARVNYQGE